MPTAIAGAKNNRRNDGRLEYRMKLRGYIVALLITCSLAPLAVAHSNLVAATNEKFVPRLGDIMKAVQSRHTHFIYEAFHGERRLLVALNLTDAPVTRSVPRVDDIVAGNAACHTPALRRRRSRCRRTAGRSFADMPFHIGRHTGGDGYLDLLRS
jgi:hypothetical protein